MTCADVLELLGDHVDGHLGEEARARVESHVEQCGECAGVLERLTEAVDALALLDAVELPEGLVERLVARVPSPASLRRRALLPSLLPGPRELRRVAGYLIVAFGLAWQLGGGAVAARAMDRAAPVLAEARQTVVRTRIRSEAFFGGGDARSGEGAGWIARLRGLIGDDDAAPAEGAP
jgi:anti-sigma factor RsiW